MALSYTGGTYFQNFDDLLSPVPANNSLVAGTVLPTGWVFTESGANANTTLRVHNGSVTTGDTILFGETGSNERALGSFASGSLTTLFGLQVVNNTGTTLTEFTLSYTGEWWRDGRSASAVQNTTAFSYGIGNASLTSGTFTPVTQLDLVGPGGVQTGSDVVLDGNLPANQTTVNFTVTGISWAPGQTLWLRWSDANDPGNDDGLAIDNVSFSAAVTPVATTPIVTITALDATAAEAGQDPGTFRISRTGATTDALTVSYTIATGAGQATNGVDYTPSLTGSVEIPVGQSFVDITITPVDDTAVEGDETVTLTLVDTADYDLGTDTTATITITDNDVAVGNLQITEYMYDGANGEFVEFTNVGNAPVDMTGWSFDDNSRVPGSFDLSAFGIVQPGESVILTEASAAAFRTAWSLPNSVKVIGGLGGSNNLGRADEINLYDNNGTLVDRLTYGDQTFPGTIRTQTRSGWAPVNQLADQIIDADWVLSSVNDAQNSRTSTGGDIGNPGHFNTGAPGVLLIESGASTNVTEGGATDTYTLVLRSQPTADVVITLNSGSQLTTSATTVTFTPGNWNIAQTVIVTAVDDTVVEGTHPGTITHTVTSTDANYDGLGVTTVTATITDNDFASLPPTITEASATPFLNLPATGSGFASGVVGDPTDPALVFGIDFTIADPDTAVGDLVVTVTSSNTAVVPNANLTLSGTGATRNLKIDPVGVGFADITVTVSDGANTDSYVINYAASAAAGTPTSTRFHTGASDASTAIALDANYMLVADDEDQTIRLYDRNGSGLPLASFDFTSFLGLSGSSEVDIEASTRLGNTIYWLGSHSNNSSGADRPNRERLFATEVSGTGASTNLTFTGYYQFLEDDLIAWDNANGHGLGAGFLGLAASAANGVLPEQTNGFNIEGLTLAPNNTTGYVSFRAPNQPTSDRNQALIIPVTNFTSLVSPTGGTAGSATFGAPIFLDLGGRGIRSIERNNTGEYVIIAGPAGAATGTAPADFRLYTWDGNPASAPVLRNADLTALNSGGSFEGIVEVPDNLTSTSQIQLLVDNGDTIWYNNGVISKDLEAPTFNKTLQKFRSDVVTLGDPVTPPVVVPPGAIPLSTPYSQDFNSLISTGTATWVDNVIEGWYTARTGTGTSIAASNGSATGGNLYSFGATNDSDRALGSIGSGNVAAGNFFWGARFFNDTNSTIDTLYLNYFGEQWRSGNAAAQTVDFQYQIGATSLVTGAWIDANSLDFTSLVNNTTAGALNGNASTNRTLISGFITDLSLAPGQDIWFRWVDIDHPGTDHGMAIDDVLVSTAPLPGITLLESGGSIQVNEAGATTDTYTIALNTVPNAPVAITIAANDGQTLLSLDGVTFSATVLLNLTNTTPATITVKAVDDTLVEGLHTGIITHSISSSDTLYNSLTVPNVVASILDNDVLLTITKIHAIQGTGATANFLGQTKTIEAIVIGDFQSFDGNTGSNLRGFYVQEEDADADNNPLTSEGIFIFDDNFGVDVKVGDKVQVTGVVSEFTSGTSSLTQLGSISNITILSSNNPLPSAVILDFPVASPASLEAYESMLVTIPTTLTVTEHFQLGRFGQVVLSADGPSNQPGTDGRLDQFTQFNAPSVSGYNAYLAELATRRIVLDDGLTIQNPDPIIHGRGGQPLNATNTLRGGDTVTGLTGILDDRFGAANLGNYRIQPVAPVDFQPVNPRPTSTPEVGGSLKVASFNVLNYFNGNGLGGGFTSPEQRGAENLAEFNRQRDKTIAAILGMDADVIGLIELENDGYGPLSAIQDLVNGLNAVAGAGTYAFIDPGTPVLGGDAIAVGFIYKPSNVTPVGIAATVPNGFGQGAFDNNNRKPLAQTFQENASGEQFTAVINHFKSKGSSAGNPGDSDIGDGQGASNGTRTRAAQDLAAWLATNPTGIADPDYLILGDLNAYAKEDPIVALLNAGYTNLLPDSTYSFVFDGQWGSLDYALATGNLVGQVTGAAKWHINADEPNVLDYNTNFKSAGQITSLYAPNAFRSSDHDPVLVGLNLSSVPQVNGQPATIYVNKANIVVGNAFEATEPYAGTLASNTDGTANPNDVILGTNGDDAVWAGLEGDDLISTGEGNDTIGISAGNSIVYAGSGDDFVYTAAETSGTNTIDLGSGDNSAWLAVGNNAVTASPGNNTIGLGSGNNTVTTGSGNDFVYTIGTSGTNTIHLGDGNNDAWLQSGNNTITTGNGDDRIGLGTGNNTVNTGDGNDIIYSIGTSQGINTITLGNGNNTIWMQGGTNTIIAGNGNNTIGLGAGNDTVITGNGNNVIYLLNATGITNTSPSGNDTITTGSGDDQVYLGVGNHTINVGDGNNTVSVRGGTNTIIGGSGNDQFFGGLGNDTLIAGTGNNLLFGDAGSDIFGLVEGGFARIIDFAVGIDFLGLTNGLTFADLSFSQSGNNTLISTANGLIAQLDFVAATSITGASFQTIV